jgi:hypothetical protein
VVTTLTRCGRLCVARDSRKLKIAGGVLLACFALLLVMLSSVPATAGGVTHTAATPNADASTSASSDPEQLKRAASAAEAAAEAKAEADKAKAADKAQKEEEKAAKAAALKQEKAAKAQAKAEAKAAKAAAKAGKHKGAKEHATGTALRLSTDQPRL